MKDAEQLRAWFDATGSVPPDFLRKITHGACMLAYQCGVEDGVEDVRQVFRERLGERLGRHVPEANG